MDMLIVSLRKFLSRNLIKFLKSSRLFELFECFVFVDFAQIPRVALETGFTVVCISLLCKFLPTDFTTIFVHVLLRTFAFCV